MWDKYSRPMMKLRGRIALEDAQNFLDDNKGKFIFIVEYSDNHNGPQGVIMEHGGIFEKVLTVCISHH